ncbi:MAG: iron ABC transporter permease, partial [Firmicutes bacterium]|nr:iron ABC transporter permease [Bacillota bacterium]
MINLRRNKDLAAVEGRRIGLDNVMTVLAFVLLLVIVVIPISMIIYNAFFHEGKFTFSLIVDQLTRSTTVSSMWNTIKIGGLVTLFGTIMGVFYAWLLGRSNIPGKKLMRSLFTIPYMFPPFLGAMAWDLLLNGRSGYLNRWLVQTFNLSSAPLNINTIWGIVFVEVSYYFPFV